MVNPGFYKGEKINDLNIYMLDKISVQMSLYYTQIVENSTIAYSDQPKNVRPAQRLFRKRQETSGKFKNDSIPLKNLDLSFTKIY